MSIPKVLHFFFFCDMKSDTMLCHFLHIMLLILFILEMDDSILHCSESAH